MQKNENNLDNFWIMSLAVVFTIIGLFIEPVYIGLLLSVIGVLFGVYTSWSSNNRDEWYFPRRDLLFYVLFIGFMAGGLYFMIIDDIDKFNENKDFFLILSFGLFILSSVMLSLYKRAYPISFIKEHPEKFVQQTMYRDDEHIGLKERFLYRGVKFLDENKFKKYKVDDLEYIEGKDDIKSLELDIFDLEVEAVNEKGDLQFYYKKLVYDFYHEFFINNLRGNEDLLKSYGYNFTINRNLSGIGNFEAALKRESYLYYKIWEFLKKDIKKVKVKINYIKIFKDNDFCLELILLSLIQYMRMWVNFPVGDFAKYAESVKDRNFLSAFKSMPTDIINLKSTTIAPMGIGYYYIFYKLHLDWLNSITVEEFKDSWGGLR